MKAATEVKNLVRNASAQVLKNSQKTHLKENLFAKNHSHLDVKTFEYEDLSKLLKSSNFKHESKRQQPEDALQRLMQSQDYEDGYYRETISKETNFQSQGQQKGSKSENQNKIQELTEKLYHKQQLRYPPFDTSLKHKLIQRMKMNSILSKNYIRYMQDQKKNPMEVEPLITYYVDYSLPQNKKYEESAKPKSPSTIKSKIVDDDLNQVKALGFLNRQNLKQINHYNGNSKATDIKKDQVQEEEENSFTADPSPDHRELARQIELNKIGHHQQSDQNKYQSQVQVNQHHHIGNIDQVQQKKYETYTSLQRNDLQQKTPLKLEHNTISIESSPFKSNQSLESSRLINKGFLENSLLLKESIINPPAAPPRHQNTKKITSQKAQNKILLHHIQSEEAVGHHQLLEGQHQNRNVPQLQQRQHYKSQKDQLLQNVDGLQGQDNSTFNYSSQFQHLSRQTSDLQSDTRSISQPKPINYNQLLRTDIAQKHAKLMETQPLQPPMTSQIIKYSKAPTQNNMKSSLNSSRGQASHKQQQREKEIKLKDSLNKLFSKSIQKKPNQTQPVEQILMTDQIGSQEAYESKVHRMEKIKQLLALAQLKSQQHEEDILSLQQNDYSSSSMNDITNNLQTPPYNKLSTPIKQSATALKQITTPVKQILTTSDNSIHLLQISGKKNSDHKPALQPTKTIQMSTRQQVSSKDSIPLPTKLKNEVPINSFQHAPSMNIKSQHNFKLPLQNVVGQFGQSIVKNHHQTEKLSGNMQNNKNQPNHNNNISTKNEQSSSQLGSYKNSRRELKVNTSIAQRITKHENLIKSNGVKPLIKLEKCNQPDESM